LTYAVDFGGIPLTGDFASFGLGSAISQQLAQKKILPSAEEFPKNRHLHVKVYNISTEEGPKD